MTARTRTGIALTMTAIVVVAVALRVRGLAFGLPAVYNPDEVAIMSRALGFARGDLNPHNFLYPTLYFYVLFAWIGGYFACAWIAGTVRSAAEFQQSFFTNPSGIYLAGRALSVVCGALAVVATWRLGERLVDRTTGLAAAAFLAVAPFAVRDAHYVKHDVPAALAAVLAMIAVSRAGRFGPASTTGQTQANPMGGRGRSAPPSECPALSRDLMTAGLACGLAASVHYYLVFLGVPLASVAWWPTTGEALGARLRRLGIAVGAAAVGFFAGSPFLLLEPLTAVRDIAANRRIVMDRAVDAAGGLFPSLAAYARMLASDAIGWPVIVLAVVGLVALASRRPRVALLLVAFPVTFLLFISNTVAATRYLNPVLPLLAVFAGAGVSAIAAIVRDGRGEPIYSRRTWIAAAGFTIVAAVPALHASMAVGTFFRQPDTRTLALDYMRATVPDGTTVLVQPYSVPLAQSRDGLVEALRAHLGDERRASVKFRLQLGLPRWPQPAYRVIWLGTGGLDVDKIYVDPAELGGPHGLDRLRQLGVRYVVLKGYNSLSPAAEPLAKALAREARRVAVFSPYSRSADPGGPAAAEPFLHNSDARIVPALERPGPVIELWKL